MTCLGVCDSFHPLMNGLEVALTTSKRKECLQACEQSRHVVGAFEKFCRQYHDSDYLECMNTYQQHMGTHPAGSFNIGLSEQHPSDGKKSSKNWMLIIALVIMIGIAIAVKKSRK